MTTMVGLDVINAWSEPFNIYLNGSRLNTTSVIQSGFSTGYLSVPAGPQAYQVKAPFNIATSTIQTLFSITVPTPADVYPNHTLFVTDANLNDAFVTVDNLPADTATYIRLVNSSPGSGALDMAFGNATPATNIPFKKASEFKLVSITNGASPSGQIALKLFNTGTSTPLYIDSVGFTQGSYTIYTLGTPGTAGFSIGIRQD